MRKRLSGSRTVNERIARMISVARFIRFFVAFFCWAVLLSIVARFVFADLDTLPGEEAVVVNLFSYVIFAEDLVGIFLWLLALVLAVIDARHYGARRQNETSEP